MFMLKILFGCILLLLEYVLCTDSNQKIVVGYWGYWESKLLSIENIPWHQITHINYGFASVNDDIYPTITDEAQLAKFVGVAHQHKVKTLLSIGGWFGSISMSKMASTSENRTAFVKKAVDIVLKFGLDGIDIDWEYPGKGALECNIVDYANDSDNFLLLLQQLREELDKAFNTIRVVDSISKSSTPNDAKRFPQEYKRDGEGHKLLTIAVGTVPFFKNNAPISDVSQYANVLDWIFIMMYDTYVGKSVIGPNAPLQTSTQVGSNSQSFAQSWVAWTSAHMPAHKIVMGLPFYGYGAKPKEDAMKLKRLLVSAHPSKPQGDADDSLFASPCPGAKHAYSGMWKWRSLQNTGILTDANTPGGQWVKNWDQESQTPWLYNPLTHHLISYDDPDSIGLKVDFSKCKGAKGVGIWDLSFDMYNENKDGQLLSVVNAHLYNQSSTCQQLVTFPAYRSMGPHFNALSLQELNTQENGSNRCVPKYILLSLFILLFFSSR